MSDGFLIHTVFHLTETAHLKIGSPVASLPYMTNELLPKLRNVATELLPGQQVEVTANGEDYYTIASTVNGRKSNFPPIWIASSASTEQIRAKLAHEFAQDLNPDGAPDDLSVPNLQTEGGLKS